MCIWNKSTPDVKKQGLKGILGLTLQEEEEILQGYAGTDGQEWWKEVEGVLCGQRPGVCFVGARGESGVEKELQKLK